LTPLFRIVYVHYVYTLACYRSGTLGLEMITIQVESLAQEVAKRIREMIRKGTLKKGDRIVEKSLSQAMGISRTPFREALRLLSSEGLVELVPNKGAYVAQPSMKDIREMFWVMSILEGKCARLCAKRTDEEGLQKLDDLYRKLEKQYREKNHEGYMDVNHSYHSLVQDLAGNKILSEVIDNLRQKILLYRYRQIYQPDRLKASMQEHSELQKAFREKNPAAAERIMKEHLMRQCEVLASVYSETLNSPR
jgi:DNA-binding GntR family transcriptional regulator